MTHLLLVLSLLLLSTFWSSAHALTAVCKNPTGRVLGQAGTVLQKGEAIDEADGMTGGAFTIIWERGRDKAKIVSQGTGGGEPLTDDAITVFEDDEQVTFLVRDLSVFSWARRLEYLSPVRPERA
jgi:hypothetical protein